MLQGTRPARSDCRAEDRLDGSRASQQMAQLSFGGIHRQVIRG